MPSDAHHARCEAMFEAYSAMVYRLCISQMRHVEDAQDVFSNVFLRLCAYRGTFASAEHEKAWLIRVTLNCCKTARRQRFLRRRPLPHTPSAVPDNASDDHLIGALQQLPGKERALLYLFYYEDLSVEQLSQLLHLSSAAVRKRLSRARQALKQILTGGA